MPEFFESLLRSIKTKSCHLKSNSKTIPIEIDQIRSRPTIFDEKIFDDPTHKETVEENVDLTVDWANFLMYSNLFTFGVQFIAVTLTQGRNLL